jgi:hypothetical protein
MGGGRFNKKSTLLFLVVIVIVAGILFSGYKGSLSIAPTTLSYNFNDGTFQNWIPGRDTFVSFGEVKMLYGGVGVELSRTFDFTQAETVNLSWRSKIANAFLGVYVNDVLITTITTPVGSWASNTFDISSYVVGKSAKITFKPIGGTTYVYLDDIAVSAVYKSAVVLSAEIVEAGYPYDTLSIPIHVVDNFGAPVSNLLVQYEFQVGEWYRSNTVITDSSGAVTITLTPDEPGVGTLTLNTVYSGTVTSKTFTMNLRTYLVTSITVDSIQYLNVPAKAIITVKDSQGTPVDPERILLQADVGGITVSGTLSKREIGVYEWSANLPAGRLTLKATPEKPGYFIKSSVAEVDLLQPKIDFDYNVPDSIALGSSLSVVVKTYNPQKTLMEPTTITAILRDPNDATQTITLSKISTGVYGFTYTFDKEGLYNLNFEAKAPKFDSSVLHLTLNVQSQTNPAGDFVSGFLLSPVTLAIVAASIIFAVWRFYVSKRRSK